MLNIVLFGPPGAGKGTQSEKLIEKYGLTHISTGDLFRMHLKGKTELGQKAQKYIDAGDLVPDEVVIGMVEDKLVTLSDTKGVIFDGFPRTVAQAEALDQVLEAKGTPISLMLALDVPEEELKSRLLERGKTSGRSDDQDMSKIENRIHVYQSETWPVADFYDQQGKFHKIHGVGSIDDIFDSLCKEIDQVA